MAAHWGAAVYNGMVNERRPPSPLGPPKLRQGSKPETGPVFFWAFSKTLLKTPSPGDGFGLTGKVCQACLLWNLFSSTFQK